MNRNRMWRLALTTVSLAAAAIVSDQAVEAQSAIRVNRALETQASFEREFAKLGFDDIVTIPSGDYWYDPVSGLWGVEHGPALGQMPPELALGGPLRSDASGGNTGVVVNGRELHISEAAYLQQVFGYVVPGRYWMNAMGIGGSEGGPPLFNLAVAARQAAANGYSTRTAFGSMGSDGNCSYFMTPGGSSVMTGNC